MDEHVETLRERRRRETAEHIAETGLRMFGASGYDATTMQAVAEASGVSARTLFHYFATKDAILGHWMSADFADEIRPTLLAQALGQSPLLAVRAALIDLVGRHEGERSRAVDDVLNSTPALRARKQATFIEWEHVVFGALCEMWPAPDDASKLRAVAAASITALRLALEQRRTDREPARPGRGSRSATTAGERLAAHLRRQFDLLTTLSEELPDTARQRPWV